MSDYQKFLAQTEEYFQSEEGHWALNFCWKPFFKKDFEFQNLIKCELSNFILGENLLGKN